MSERSFAQASMYERSSASERAPVVDVPRASINIASHLAVMAHRCPFQRAVVVPAGRDAAGRATWAHLTFAQLHADSDRIAHGLERAGVRRSVRTVLMVRPSLDFFSLVFALFKVGATLVLVDPGMGRRNLARCLAETEPEAFVGIPLAHVLRLLHPHAFRTVRACVTVGRRLFWGGTTLDGLRAGDGRPYEMAETSADETAAILFTSGSTGIAKGAVYAHATFDAQVRAIASHFGIEPGGIDLATFPLFALFGPAHGTTTVVPDMDASRPVRADPRKIIEAILDHGATQMFASPALLDRVARFAIARGMRLPSLRRVISAGAPVPPAVLERFTSLLAEGAEVFTPYGATEALPVACIGSREVLGETAEDTTRGQGTCVGRPVGDVTVRIIRITDGPIATWSDALIVPDGEVGEIAVRGPVVTRAYYARPEQTALAKIRDGEDVWHRMGDLGRIDARGRLWFYGRKAHRVATPSGPTLFTEAVEGIVNTHPAVLRSALVGVPEGAPAASGKRPVVVVELERAAARTPELPREILAHARANGLTERIDSVLVHPGALPVDVRHNAKIFREQLAVWAAGRLPPSPKPHA